MGEHKATGNVPELDIAVVGHVTRDIIRFASGDVREQPGGAAWYASAALAALGARVTLLTRVASADDEDLLRIPREAGVHVVRLDTAATTVFENHYDEQGNRTQRVHAKAGLFEGADLARLGEGARIGAWLLGPLLPGELGDDVPDALAAHGRPWAVDVQGLLREIRGSHVVSREGAWSRVAKAMAHASVVKASAPEFGVEPGGSITRAVRERGILNDEVVVTCGAQGAVVVARDATHSVAPVPPTYVVDPTGCGDTFLAAYWWRRLQGDMPDDAGPIAAKAATRKLEHAGPLVR